MLIRCPNCDYDGKSKKIVRGYFIMEVILWLLFLIPGVIYSLWRVAGKYNGCPKCSYQYVVKK